MLDSSKLPTKLMIEPTSRCNLECPLCISGRKEIPSKPDLTLEQFVAIFDQLTDGCSELTFHNFGEPLLNRELTRMIAYATESGCRYSTLSSNATLLTEENCRSLAECGLNSISVCVDGLTQETYGHYRVGGKLSKVEKGIRRLVAAVEKHKSHLEVVLQFIVFKHNEHQIDQLHAYALELGTHKLDVKISGSATRDPNFAPTDKLFLATNRSGGGEGPLCDWVFETIVINSDGEVMPCCWAGHTARYSMGNAFHTSIYEIWNSARYVDLRKRVSTRENLWDLCEAKCKNGLQSRHLKLDLRQATR